MHTEFASRVETFLVNLFGYIGGNIAKNGIIAATGGLFIGILVAVGAAKLFLMYKELHDELTDLFVKKVTEGKHHPNKVGASKKPLEFYMPPKVSVMRLHAKGRKNPSYIANPKTIAEVIDTVFALLILRFYPQECTYENIIRVRTIFYMLILIDIAVAVVGIVLSVHIMPPQ